MVAKSRLIVENKVVTKYGFRLNLSAESDGAKIFAAFDKLVGQHGEKKFKFGLSVCSGCAVKCNYCFINDIRQFRILSASEIVDQYYLLLDYLNTADVPKPDEEIKITFKQMGDPLLNPENILEAIRHLTKINSSFNFIISTSAPKANHWFYDALAEQTKSSNIRLAFSCHTTSDAERAQLNPEMRMLTLGEIADVIQHWPNDGKRITLNFIIINGFTYDVNKLVEVFDPNRIFIKINHFDDNNFVRAAGLKNAPEEKIVKFTDALTANNIPWTRR